MDTRELLKKLTLTEKLYQLQQSTSDVFMQADDMPITGAEIINNIPKEHLYDIGSLYNTYGAERNLKLQKEYLEKSKNKIPLAFMLDIIHGYKTIYPINLGLSSSFDDELVKECSKMAAKEASVDGIHATFSPMLDVSRDARWGRCMESCGEDTYLTCRMAKASIEGFQGDGGKYTVGAGFKHIAGYSLAPSGKDYDSADISERSLREFFLPPYKSAMDAGAMMAMPAQNIVNGIPGNVNSAILKDILRDEWGFDGVVISDYASILYTVKHGYCENHKDATLAAFNAGVDVEMASNCYILNAEELVKEGKITEKQIDEAVLRVLELKKKLGLFDNPYGCMNIEEAKKILLCNEHREIARKAAQESAVLLKNDGVLPFSKDVKSVAIIGPHANNKKIVGSWWCACDFDDTVTVYEGVKELLPNAKISCAQGCDLALDSSDYSKIGEAVKLAKEADIVILCVGEDMMDSGESNSKSHLDLPSVQKELIKEVVAANKNTAMVLFTGRPLVLTEENKTVGAILNMYFPGTEGGCACANLIFGECVPCGKLTMSFPHNVGQCPIYYNHHKTANYRVDDTARILYTSSYIDGPNKPLFPFGHGLSYTNFEYYDFKLSANEMSRGEKIVASIKVKNIGKYKAKEIVQMYIQDPFASIVRPIKELKGYTKIELLPSEEATVEFEISEDTLAFVGADLQRKAECGIFNIFIGKDSTTDECLELRLI